jgi:hypothetical protein
MNGQETQTQSKANAGKTPDETKTESRSESARGVAGATGSNAGDHGKKTGRRRKANNAIEAESIEANKIEARKKISKQIEALETIEAVI